MSEETTQKTRKPRTNRVYGLAMTVRILVPVDRKDLKNQIAVSEAAMAAQKNGEFSAILSLPGARISPAGRNGGIMFGALPSDAFPSETIAASDGDGDQGDIEEAISETAEIEPEAEAAEETHEEASTSRGRGRRAA